MDRVNRTGIDKKEEEVVCLWRVDWDKPELWVALAYDDYLLRNSGEVYLTVRGLSVSGKVGWSDPPEHRRLKERLVKALQATYPAGHSGYWWQRWALSPEERYMYWSNQATLRELASPEKQNGALPYFTETLSRIAKIVEAEIRR
jgi:hypothetical protein